MKIAGIILGFAGAITLIIYGKKVALKQNFSILEVLKKYKLNRNKYLLPRA